MKIAGWLWWFYLVATNFHRCHLCGKHGCCREAYPDESQLCYCLRCGRRYWKWNRCSALCDGSPCGETRSVHATAQLSHEFVPSYEEIN